MNMTQAIALLQDHCVEAYSEGYKLFVLDAYTVYGQAHYDWLILPCDRVALLEFLGY